MFIEIIFVIIGFAILVKSADVFIDGVLVLAKKIQVEEIVIGITLVALGTSLPELFVNLSAAERNLDDVLFGNVLGSSIFNLFLILGIQTSFKPLKNISKKTIVFDFPIALLLVVLLWLFVVNPITGGGGERMEISWKEGAILSGLYVLFLIKQYCDFRLKKKHSSVTSVTPVKKLKEDKNFELKDVSFWVKRYYYVFVGLGIVGLYFGSEIAVSNSVKLAIRFGMSEAFIGVFILSVGTSLPELITSLMAIQKQYSRIALGNVLGSNICNIGIVLAFFSWLGPISYNPKFNITFMALTFVTSYLFLALLLKKDKGISRIEGILLVLSYVGYAAYSYYDGL